jgi:hypothetical protein
MSSLGCGARPSGSSSGTVATVSGSIADALYKTRVSGVEVCVIEPERPCVESNAQGEFQIADVPKNTRILIQFIRNQYYPNMAHYSVGDTAEFLTYALASDDVSDLVAGLAGVTRDDSKGAIIFGARDDKGPDAQNVTDVSVALTPLAGEGPFYATPTDFDDNATGTTSVGGGAIFNVPEGEYLLVYGHPSRSCTAYYGWQGEQAGTLQVRVRAGFSTYVSQVCPP